MPTLEERFIPESGMSGPLCDGDDLGEDEGLPLRFGFSDSALATDFDFAPEGTLAAMDVVTGAAPALGEPVDGDLTSLLLLPTFSTPKREFDELRFWIVLPCCGEVEGEGADATLCIDPTLGFDLLTLRAP
mmetsp:Transcript_4451/g.10482  ORF Transcript_4451/g.10482 Transcript_4451/m.10482 type:complete len:131 (+) Transcript_4451:673-1065(+)|eukprot:CAMPEP_0114493342 /NCGR_PEP_ID=MMETSP0109-20121206/4057_1 /TAXON_ID=29199 /ORGANISM="Chlorarachnion reptans, Strain CCCM449" /LENGTH=130 /DNA_ID=CAMNT_0001670285 /DNA_START=667 /DNA_END=1059 /DNA_ORIENTATION=+